MKVLRRDILKAGAAFSAVAALPKSLWAQASFGPRPGAWRSYLVITEIELSGAKGEAAAWIPVPTVNEKDWFQSHGTEWKTNGSAELVRDLESGAKMLRVQWKGNETPAVQVMSKVSVLDRAIDLTKPHEAAQPSLAEQKRYTAGTKLIPVDGIVKQTSDKITAGKKTNVEKAHAIYEWIVDNTFRNAATRGCGVGDIAAMLTTGNLGGKCADLNALFVGLVRAAGIPARDIYGIRIAPSQLGYKSLGVASEIITKAQHCRAEVYLTGLGWVPADPADVRKVALEEPPTNLAMDDPKVVAARKALFGSWETNWLAYNFAHDVALPGSKGPALGFLMYPQAEIAGIRLDCLDADNFKYTIRSKEITAA